MAACRENLAQEARAQAGERLRTPVVQVNATVAIAGRAARGGITRRHCRTRARRAAACTA